MNSLLHVRVHDNHALVELRMLSYEHFRIPCHSNKEGVDAARQRGSEAVRNLQTNEEGVRDHDRSEASGRVVGWVGEVDVEVGEECT